MATVVVEAGSRSGSLNTAGHAAALGRPLGAVPGPVTSPASAGCHRLLREYDAVCVTGVDDMAELVPGCPPSGAWGAEDLERAAPRSAGTVGGRDTAETVRVLDALSTRSARTPHDVAVRSGLAVTAVLGVLAVLELDGRARDGEGGWVAVAGRR